MSSGQASAFFGRWPLSIEMRELPRPWMQCATFRRTCGTASASRRCRSLARTSACACSPRRLQSESSSVALLRHCRSSTALCSRTGCST